MNALVLGGNYIGSGVFSKGSGSERRGPGAIARLPRNEDARKMMGSCKIAEPRGRRCKESPICVICFWGNTMVEADIDKVVVYEATLINVVCLQARFPIYA